MRKAVPLFQQMQVKIDRLNLVLDEGLSGVRVIRAFDRGAHESRRFDEANLDVTGTAIAVNRLVALLMPTMFFMMNLTSVLIIWFGSLRIDAGEMHVGAMMASLQYAIQILFAVFMVTAVFVMLPRAAASAERINEVLDVVPDVNDPPQPEGRRHDPGPRRVPGRDVPVSGRRRTGADGRVVHGAAGRGDRGHRRHRLGQVHARRPDPALLRRRRRPGARGRRGRQGHAAGRSARRHRLRAAEGRAVLGHDRQQHPLRPRRGHRRGHAPCRDGGAGRRVHRSHAGRLRLAGLAGRHQPVRRPEAAPGDRPRAGAPRRHLRVRRQLLGARLRHRRQAARRAAGRHRRRHRVHRLAAHRHRDERRPDRRAGRWPGRRHRHGTRSCCRPATSTARSRNRRRRSRRWRERRTHLDAAVGAGRRHVRRAPDERPRHARAEGQGLQGHAAPADRLSRAAPDRADRGGGRRRHRHAVQRDRSEDAGPGHDQDLRGLPGAHARAVERRDRLRLRRPHPVDAAGPLRGERGLPVPAAVPDVGRGAADGLRPAPGGRGEVQPPAAPVLRLEDARRDHEPGRQRPRQHQQHAAAEPHAARSPRC